MLLFSLLQDLLIVSPVRISLGADAQYPGSLSQSQRPTQVVKFLLMENARQGAHSHCAGFPGNDHRIAPPGLPQQPHAKGRVVIRAGQKGVGTGPQDVPGQGAGLPAAQPRHHAVHIPGHRVELPILLYNVPSRTGVSFTAETYQLLSQHPNINGVKEASGNFSLLSHTRALCGDDFHIWSGNDDQVVPMMSLGAKGVVSVAANLVPEVMVQMSHLCLEGRFREAAALQIEYTDLIDALFLEVNPIPIKTALNLAGYEVGSLRLPLCAMSDGHLETLRRAMESAHLLQ